MSELERTLVIAEALGRDRATKYTADAHERAALLERLGLVSLDAFSFTIAARKDEAGHGIWLDGHLNADLAQRCVLTLEPVPAQVEGDFSTLFVASEDDLDALEEDEERWGEVDIDVHNAGTVDVGELAVQYLSLMLEPYPRAQGAEVVDPVHTGLGYMTEEEAISSRSPFAVLKQNKDKS